MHRIIYWSGWSGRSSDDSSGEDAALTLTEDGAKAIVSAAADQDADGDVDADDAKKLAIEQLSFEQATTYDGSFALLPQNAVVKCNITDLASTFPKA